MLYLVLIAIVFVSSSLLIHFRTRAVLRCTSLIRHLRPKWLAVVNGALEKDHLDLWVYLGGFEGLYARWKNRIPLVRLCQVEALAGNATHAELAYAFTRATQLTRVSIWIIFWHVLRSVAPERERRALLRGARLYSEIAMHTYSLLVMGDAPLCAQNLKAVL